MRSTLTPFLLLALAWMAGCGGCSGTEPPAANEPDVELLEDPPLAVRPHLALSVNATARPLVGRTWPAVVDLTVLHPDYASEEPVDPMVLASAPRWSDLVTLTLTDEAEAEVPVSWALVEPVSDSATLDATQVGHLRWTVGSFDVVPGRYELRATLDTDVPGSQSSWRGEAQSPPVVLTVTEPAMVPAESAAFEERTARARYFVSTGDLTAAEAQIDTLLAAEPESVAGRVWKADLLAARGDKPGALSLLNAVLAEPAPQAGEPPVEILRRRDALLRDLYPAP